MPTDLAALLLREQIVSEAALERAKARQLEAGGSLDTAVLELGLVPEDALLGLLARAAELPAASEIAWSAADARARRVFPSKVAERHGLAPFALEGRELSLVATYPVDLALLDEISFMLSLHLTAHVGPEWRVRELIHRLYGGSLEPRFAALAAAAGAAPAPPEEPPEPGDAAPASRPEVPAAPSGFTRDAAEPLEPLAAALQQALDAVDAALFEEEAVEEAEAPAPGPPPDRSAPPRWSLDDARTALAAARHRDEIVLAALRYARDFFEYAAVFAVTRDAVAGHDALGAEDERERARSIALYASDPGIFRTVIETKSPFLGPVSREAAGNATILDGLGRGLPRTVLVYPVLLRDRTVCVLYADNGEAPVSPRRLGDLLLLLSTVGAAFERIIRGRKRRPSKGLRALEALSQGSLAAAPPSPAPPAPEAVAEEEPPPEAPAPPEEHAAPAPEAPEPALAPPEPEPPPAAEPVPEPLPGEPEPAPSVEADPAPPAEAPAESPPRPSASDSLDALEEQFFFRTADADLPSRAPIPRADAATTPPVAPGAAPPPEAPAAPAPPERPALPVLADKALDPDPAVATWACEALAERRREPAMRQAIEKLRRALLSGISGRTTRAARALGVLRDVESIPLLIQVLETSEPETAGVAAEALAAITLQRLGPDARKWLGWWKQNRGRGRAEWLFSGLTSPDRDTRIAAAVELRHAAPPPVEYSADLPAPERERMARAWAGWWARSGHVL